MRPRLNMLGVTSIANAFLGMALVIGVTSLSLLGLFEGTAVASPCVNEALRVGPSVNLPDCRAYEQVSPVGVREKNGTSAVGDELNVLRASPGGDAATYYVVTGTGTESSAAYPVYIAKRINGSWTSDGINPPSSLGNEAFRLAYTENLTGSYTVTANPTGETALYLREFGGKLVKVAPASYVFSEEDAIAAESEDGNVVLYESKDALTEGSTEGFSNVYAWTKSTGSLALVDKLPNGSTPVEGGYAGPWSWFSEIGGGSAKRNYTQTSLNRSGTRAFFTDANSHQIYLRDNPTSPAATTTLISASQKTNGSGTNGEDPNGQMSADFLEATPDGRYVFFKSHSALTNTSNTGPNDEGQDLYRYDVATGDLLDVAPLSTGAGAEILGLAGSSNNGTYAYFVAKAALAGTAVSGAENVYMWHEGSPLQFVATINEGLLPGFTPGGEIWIGTRYNSTFRGQKTGRVSPDGRTFAFNSIGPQVGLGIGPGTPEVYRWEVEGAGLQCVSCSLTTKTLQPASFQSTPDYFIKPEINQSTMTENLSTNGKRLIFSTNEALVPADVNGVEDVYEWEAPGEGSCLTAEQNGGCILLISTGTSPDRSYLDDSSASGNDVFFFTDQNLVGQDRDELYDVYDARVGGGIPSQNPLLVPPCEGEGCLAAGTSPAPSQSRGSSNFAGPGNPKPKRPRPKKPHKPKHHKKKHHKKKHAHRSGGGR